MLYAPAELGGRVGFIFGSIAIISFVFTYFCVPECKGKMLEEIDIMFHDGVPVRKFQTTHIGNMGVDSGKKVDQAEIEEGIEPSQKKF